MTTMQQNFRNRPRQTLTTEEIDKTILYLSRAFANATYKAGKIIGFKAERVNSQTNSLKTTELYDYQVEFVYLLDNIKRCPSLNLATGISLIS